MYNVNYNGRTSCVSNYFYCRVRPQWLLDDAERDLFAIAKFFFVKLSGDVLRTQYLSYAENLHS